MDDGDLAEVCRRRGQTHGIGPDGKRATDLDECPCQRFAIGGDAQSAGTCRGENDAAKLLAGHCLPLQGEAAGRRDHKVERDAVVCVEAEYTILA